MYIHMFMHIHIHVYAVSRWKRAQVARRRPSLRGCLTVRCSSFSACIYIHKYICIYKRKHICISMNVNIYRYK